MNSWRLWLGIACFAVVIWMWGFGSRPEVPVLVATPRRGDLARVIREEARTRYRTIFTVTMPIDGRLAPQAAEEGTRVTTGDLLAQVQEDIPEALVRSLKAELAAGRAELELARDVSDDTARVAAARAGETAARAALEARRREFEAAGAMRRQADLERTRIHDLSQRGAASSADRDRVENEAQRTRAVEAASRSMVDAAAAEAAAAEARRVEAEALLAAQGPRIAQLEARVDALEARMVPATDDRSRVQVAAPFPGEILHVHHRSGGFLPRGTPLFELGDPTTLEIEADLLSEDAARLLPDGAYGVYGGALGEGERPVRLREVSPRGFIKRSSLGVEESRVHVWFTFATEPPRGLGHGYALNLRAALEIARAAPLIPRRAMFRTGRGWSVCTLEGDRASFLPVEPRLGDESWVALVRPLPEGVRLALDPPETLEPGDRLRPRPALDLPDPALLPGLAAPPADRTPG